MIWIKAIRRRSSIFCAMNEPIELFRRRIALYRKYLAEGVDAALAQEYLHEIARAEAELVNIKNEANKVNEPAPQRAVLSSPCRAAPR